MSGLVPIPIGVIVVGHSYQWTVNTDSAEKPERTRST